LVDPNTRQGKRTPVTLKIKFKSETLEQFIERYAVDVSQGGIFIRTKEPLAVGTQMKFEFQLRDASPLIAGEGTVVWTRENDPSRPAIAPGMGVRFDRLADGSQGILERILTEKAKQAPQRPSNDTAKPPMFTDTPTRVAPAPVQEALLGRDSRSRRSSDEPQSDSHTPLPKPMPFHSDADEFPDEAFEEATKVRALDELIAQTAEGGSSSALGAAANGAPVDDLITRRNGRVDPPVEPASERLENARAALEVQEAPGLPSPPEPMSRPLPKLLDTSPSPRNEAAQPGFVSESMARTRIGVGVEPARSRSNTPAPSPIPAEAPPLPAGVRAVAAETTEPARMPPIQSRSIAPIAILILLLIAAGGAAVWFFVLRPQAAVHTDPGPGSQGSVAQNGPAGVGSAGSAGPAATNVGSAAVGTGPGPGSSGSAAVPATAGSNAPKAELVDTVIGASADGSTVEIVGTGQSGPAPLTAKLEKGKPYKARITAHGFASLELDIKGGDDKQIAKLVAKPRMIAVESDPTGALIWIDNSSTGHSTPAEIELTAAQAAKKSVHVQLRKSGYKTIDRVVDLGKLTEDDTKLGTKLEEKLSVQTVPTGGGTHTGGNTGSAKNPGTGSDGDSGSTTEPVPAGSGAAPTPPPDPNPAGSGGGGGGAAGGGGGAAGGGGGAAGGGGGSAEPEPDFNKKP
jgi:uncharacterized protein (TIGR02266 family)